MHQIIAVLAVLFGWVAMASAQDQLGILTEMRHARQAASSGKAAESDGLTARIVPERGGTWLLPSGPRQGRLTPGVVNLARIESNARATAPTSSQANPASMGRQGFIAGVGGGIAVMRDAALGVTNVVTDFKIGYAPSDQWLLYSTNQIVWGSIRDTLGISGFGVTHMFNPTWPSAFLTGAIGASVGTGSSDLVLSFIAGGGYEVAPHFSVGAEWMSLDIGLGRRESAYAFTFDWLYY